MIITEKEEMKVGDLVGIYVILFHDYYRDKIDEGGRLG